MIEQGLEHRRHPGHAGGLLAVDRGQHLSRLETRQQDHAAATHHGAVEHAGVGEDMEQRQRAEDHIAFGAVKGIEQIDLLRVGRQVCVSQHGPLGCAGGAAGVLQQREVGGNQRGKVGRLAVKPLPPVPLGQPAAPQPDIRAPGNRGHLAPLEQPQAQPLQPRQFVRQPHHHQLLERRGVEHLARGRQQGRRIERHQQPRPRIRDLRGQFLHTVERREIDHHRARHHRPVVSGDISRDIGQEQPDPIAPGNAARGEAGSETAGIGIQPAIAEGPPQKRDQRRLGCLLRLPREQIVQQHRPDRAVPRVRMGVAARGRGGETLAYSHVSTMHGRPQPRKSPRTSAADRSRASLAWPAPPKGPSPPGQKSPRRVAR